MSLAVGEVGFATVTVRRERGVVRLRVTCDEVLQAEAIVRRGNDDLGFGGVEGDGESRLDVGIEMVDAQYGSTAASRSA